PTVAIVSNTASVCTGGNATFTASGTNAGTAPAFIWFKNGISQGTGSTFTLTPTNGDQVTAILTVGGSVPNCLSSATASSNVINLTVNPCLKPQVSSITGPAFVPNGTSSVSYTVPSVPGDTYLWTIPAGTSIVGGQGTNSIILAFGSNVIGVLTLTQTNAYGSTSVQLDVQSGSAPTLGTIIGLNAVSPNQTGVTYAVPNDSTTTYQWTVPTGATVTAGQGTNSITVDFGATVAGNIEVIATNPFGTTTATLAISPSVPTDINTSSLGIAFAVYPNPSNGTFYLESAFGEINIFNLQGDLMESRKIGGNSPFGENYPAGVFILQYKNESSLIQTLRLVKIK
ncbi:MAG: T9SS type A sorting domain-containing protein, partial [Cytophagales bacterium]|nr:T9SS type A sorting domain-containing protein [Cytophagales bacterium]